MVAQPVPLRPRQPVEALPPFDAAAEEAVIAAVLLDDQVIEHLRFLRPEDFFRDQNAWVYEAALTVAERGEPVTIPTVAHELERMGRLDDAGGELYLVEVAGKYFTAIGVEAHARIVVRDAFCRRLIDAAGHIASIAYRGGNDFERLLGMARETLLDVEAGYSLRGLGSRLVGPPGPPPRRWVG